MARRKAPKGKKKKSKGAGGSSKGSAGGGSAGFGTQTVWRAGVDPIEDGEELSYDPTTYECLHRFRFSWPCLSFDVPVDGLGEREKTQFPYECTVVAGTQAGDPNENAVCLARLSNVCQGKHGAKRKSKKAKDEDGDGDEMDMEMDVSSSDSESDSEEEEGEQPYFSAVEVHHRGGINRIRCLKQQGSCIVASWGETGHVQVWDLSSHMKMLSEEKIGPRTQKNKVKQVHQTPLHIAQHTVEGYALDWSRTNSSLLTGDCSGKIMLTRHDGTLVNWQTDSQGFADHSASVEDLQWSPAEDTVFASCSVDKTIKIWDTRQRGKPGLSYEAHETDINVISWNALTSCMIASGGDDGTMRIWDMRFISNKQYVANFDYCKKAITSIEWSPYEGSMVATSSADNQICFWDLSVERDAAEEVEHINAATEGGEVEIPVDIPPQLLFVHGGQDNVKEVHWHEQIKGAVVSTAYDGFNIFAAANI